MTLLKAEMLVQCPKDNVKTEVKNCVSCKHYEHMVFEGGVKAYCCCLFPNVKKKEDALWG